MSLKKLGVALLAVFVLGAIAANSAFAENEYVKTGAQIYVGGTALPPGGTLDLTVSGGASSLTSTIATKAIKFSSTGVSGLECSGTNPTTTSATIDCKSLTFSGVTVSGEAAVGCSTPTTITTKELTATIGMNKAGTRATLDITPKAGAGTTFATIELTGSCANAGLYKVTGTVFAEASNATGVFAKTQNLEVSETIQKSAGTATSLKFGENGAFIKGNLEGTAASEWGAKEK